MSSFVEAWENAVSRQFEFRGAVSNRDMSMDPREVVARVKQRIVDEIVARVMERLGPKLDEAIESAWRNNG